jgi:hypothetical protein
MPQQPQSASQYAFGPASNGGGDIIHYIGANANPTGPNLLGWVDKNGANAGVSFVVNGLQSSAAAPITGAAGGVFSYTSNGIQATVSLPGASAMEQVPFIVRAGGYVSLGAGTYTASVQPLLYASTTAGFTAAAANAIFSAAAVGWTVTSATPIAAPYFLEAHLFGDSTSGKVSGWTQGAAPTAGTGGTVAFVDITALTNAPTSVSFTAAIPLQFAVGVTLSTTAVASSVVNLGSLTIES